VFTLVLLAAVAVVLPHFIEVATDESPLVDRPPIGALAFAALLTFAGAAFAADVADVKPASTDALQQLAIHAAGIAVFIRGVIALLRSPLLGLVWGKVPEPARVAVLLLLGAIAVAFDHVAVGTPLLEAFASAFVGLFGVVGGHEMAKRVIPPRPTKATR
jgi:hypothetical protein